MKKEIPIIYEDQEILVCEKPPGIPSQSDKSGDYDMVNYLKNYIYRQNPKGGQPYIGVVHRLDRPVGGVMVFAKHAQAAGRLSESIRTGAMKKRYYVVLNFDGTHKTADEWVQLTDYLAKDARTNLSCVVEMNVEETGRDAVSLGKRAPGIHASGSAGNGKQDAKRAELLYQVKAVKDGLSLVEVELLTGRHHQIRVQMAAHLGGIWGDTKYNSEFQTKKGWYEMGLYSHYLEFPHPKTGKLVSFEQTPKTEPFTNFFA